MKFINTNGEITDQTDDSKWECFNHKSLITPDPHLEKILTQDPVSGKGHFLFLPRGAIMFNLLKQYMYDFYSDLDCFFLESPMLTDYNHSAVKNHAEMSGENTYHILTEGQHLVTKIGALYSQLELTSNGFLPSEVMPLKLFEMTRCCRIEDNPSPLRRSCEFTMVDMHELCINIEEALEDSLGIHKKILELAKEFGWDFYTTLTVTDDFISSHQSWLRKLTEIQGKESMILPADPRKGRPINAEYHIIGEGPLEISAFQIDYQNPEKFQIYNGDGTHPVLIHANIVGSIERFMYAIISSAKEYPIWLAPEQVRIIPESSDDIESALNIGQTLRKEKIRVTVDDRIKYNIDERFVLAKKDKVQYTYHVQGGNHTCLAHGFSPQQLVEKIETETVGNPSLRATYPLRLSRWMEYF